MENYAVNGTSPVDVRSARTREGAVLLAPVAATAWATGLPVAATFAATTGVGGADLAGTGVMTPATGLGTGAGLAPQATRTHKSIRSGPPPRGFAR